MLPLRRRLDAAFRFADHHRPAEGGQEPPTSLDQAHRIKVSVLLPLQVFKDELP